MATLSLLIAFAVAGGHISFAGAVETPTAASVPMVERASAQSTPLAIAQTGRFNDPPRVISTRPMDRHPDRTVVVVTYL